VNIKSVLIPPLALEQFLSSAPNIELLDGDSEFWRIDVGNMRSSRS
jgi:hypothetical protein